MALFPDRFYARPLFPRAGGHETKVSQAQNQSLALAAATDSTKQTLKAPEVHRPRCRERGSGHDRFRLTRESGRFLGSRSNLA
jgi:hypothetical protein